MEQIIYSISEYKILAAIVSFLIIFIETFVPVLPLVAIVGANSIVLGLWVGFLISWLGSSFGSIILFLLSRKFSSSKIFIKITGKRLGMATNWIKKQGFTTIFISYLCPFIPDCLITIASGISDMKLSNFLPGMCIGKFIVFMLISYVGNDIETFFSSPIKIFMLSIVIVIFWIIGNKINKRINN